MNLYGFVGNDPVDQFDPLGLLPPSAEACQALARKIANLEEQVRKRTRELYEDPQGLPGSAPGDDKKPSLSRRGHDKLLNMAKANLAAKKALYQANCSDPEPKCKQITGKDVMDALDLYSQALLLRAGGELPIKLPVITRPLVPVPIGGAIP